MKNNRKAWIIFRRIILLLFIVYLINYYQVESGNGSKKNITIMTSEKIKEFEQDVKNGEFVDIKDYTENNFINTSNTMSDAGYLIGEKVSSFVNTKLINFFKFIGEFIS